MALQTETSSSTTSTASSSSSSSAGTTNDNPDSGSFFTPTSSPPLILAFLAIGLLVTAIIAALGWRRAYFARFRQDAGNQMRRGQTHKANTDVGNKPKLWDLWTTSGRGPIGMKREETGMNCGSREIPRLGVDRDINWETVMPISVTPIIRKSIDDQSELGQGLASERISLVSLFIVQSRQLLGSIIHYFRRPRQQQSHEVATAIPSAVRVKEVQGRRIVDDTDADDLDQCESIQIAMAIAMPMPKDGKLFEESDRRPEVYEYSVGVCRVPWSKSREEEHDLSE